jgi:hypothetical protein
VRLGHLEAAIHQVKGKLPKGCGVHLAASTGRTAPRPAQFGYLIL